MAHHTIDWQDTPPEACRHGAVTVGNFDGVHRGHAALIAKLREQAHSLGGPAVVLTFHPHPVELLRPGQSPPPLTSPEDRAEWIQVLGADHVLTLRITLPFLALSAEQFFTDVLRERLAVQALVEGENFGFGHNREGNVATLAVLCQRAGIPLTVVPPVEVAGQTVSSSRIRSLLQAGAVGEVTSLLGRPYLLRGTVVAGQRRGKALGFPTANLEQIPTLIPGSGVYAVRVRLDGSSWPGAANLGPNPTFAEQQGKVEVHLIGYQGDLYGRSLALELLHRLRDTRKFSGVSELKEQLKHDIAQAQRWVERSDESLP
jgi:riboflavin kinase/FMN adenylyltransferase